MFTYQIRLGSDLYLVSTIFPPHSSTKYEQFIFTGTKLFYQYIIMKSVWYVSY